RVHFYFFWPELDHRYWPEVWLTACGHNECISRHAAVDGLDVPLREETPFRQGICNHQQALGMQQPHHEVLLNLIRPNHLYETLGDTLPQIRGFLFQENRNHAMPGKTELPILGQCPVPQLTASEDFPAPPLPITAITTISAWK